MLRAARPPERFAGALASVLDERAPFVRRSVGPDAKLVALGSRLLPGGLFQWVASRAMGLPRPGSQRGATARSAPSLTHLEQKESHG